MNSRAAKMAVTVLVLIVAAAAIGIVFIAAYNNVQGPKKGHIANGITIEKTDVGGLTAGAAEKKVQALATQLENQEVSFQTGGKTVTATAEELGITWKNTDVVQEALRYTEDVGFLDKFRNIRRAAKGKDFPLELELDSGKFQTAVKAAGASLADSPDSYGIELQDGKIQIVHNS